MRVGLTEINLDEFRATSGEKWMIVNSPESSIDEALLKVLQQGKSHLLHPLEKIQGECSAQIQWKRFFRSKVRLLGNQLSKF